MKVRTGERPEFVAADWLDIPGFLHSHHPYNRVQSDKSSAARGPVLGLVLRFKYKTLKQPVPASKVLTQKAESALVRWSQGKHFPAELRAVSAGEPLPLQTRFLQAIKRIDDEGVLRARTSLTLGPHLTQEEREPMIIAGESRLAALFILNARSGGGVRSVHLKMVPSLATP